MIGKTWTPEKITLLKKLADEGLSGAEIAKKIGGVTRCAVIGKANRMRLRLAEKQSKKNYKSKWSDADTERLRGLWDDFSIPIKYIARELGRSNSSVTTKAKQLDLKSRRYARTVKVIRFLTPAQTPVIPLEGSKSGAGLIDMDRSQCRFAVSPHDAKPHEHVFCGNDVINGSAYCAYHHEITHRQPNAFEEKVAKC